MQELQRAQEQRGESLRAQGEFSDHSNEENEQNYRDEEQLKQSEFDEFGQKHGMSPQQVKALQDDINKATKNWEDGWFTKADRARLLSDGRIVVNPSLYLSTYEYVDAVVKSGGSMEEQRRALSALPALRARASQQLYDALVVLAPVKEFLDQQPGDVTHKIAALIEEQQRYPIWNKLSGQFGAGADDVAAAGIGLLAMVSGQTAQVEKLIGKGPMEGVTHWLEQWASYATQRGAAMDQLSGLSKTDGLIDATGHVVRMVPELLAMEATGGVARGTLQAARFGEVVEAGSEAAQALSAAGQTGGTAYLGTRSTGATYLQALQAGIDTGKSLEEARTDALAPALVTGVLSYATFSAGGTKGLTNIFRSEAATRDLLQNGFKAFAQDMGVTMGAGGLQMGLDSLAHDIVAQRSYHPDLTDEEILEHVLTSSLNGAAFAGFTRAVHGAASEAVRLGKAAVRNRKDARIVGKSAPVIVAEESAGGSEAETNASMPTGADSSRSLIEANEQLPPSQRTDQPRFVRNSNKGVDFAKSSDLYPIKEGQKNIVRISYTGSRGEDFKAANIEAQLGRHRKPPHGYTWHHLDDYDSKTNTGTMQLVKRTTHLAAGVHFGGVRQYERFHKKKYKR